MSTTHWKVEAAYSMTNIEEFHDVKKLVTTFIPDLEKRLHKKIRHFAEERDGHGLYLIESMGVLGIRLLDGFEVKGEFVLEEEVNQFKEALERTISKILPKEISDEMLRDMIVVETGIDIEILD